MKIQNIKLANRKVHFSVGAVDFDANGVADVQPDEFAKSVLELDDFFPVDAEVELPDGTVETDGKNMTDMTAKELDQLAEQLEVVDYPAKGTKEVKMAAIGAHIAETNKGE